ncbi:MAG TPA: hypothetical protein VFZ43_00725 [Anaerolineales bacterium]
MRSYLLIEGGRVIEFLHDPPCELLCRMADAIAGILPAIALSIYGQTCL